MNSSQTQSLHFILEEFSAQRRYRQQKRIEYLRRFEAIKLSVGLKDIKPQIPQNPPQPVQQEANGLQENGEGGVGARLIPSHENSDLVRPAAFSKEEEDLLAESISLTKRLQELQQKSGEQIANFKKAIEGAKTQYVGQIQMLVDKSKRTKEENQAKMIKLKEQTEKAIQKNQEIETVNNAIKSQLNQGPKDHSFEEVLEQIRKQYDEKIASFKAVFESSNEKIEALEKDFNEEEFIESTVTNEQLLKSIETNASKAEEAAKLLEDYKSLSEGKKEILSELLSSMEMKEQEIAKMTELQQKMKIIMDKLNSEKQKYMQENNSMAKQLMEIKELLLGAVGQSQE